MSSPLLEAAGAGRLADVRRLLTSREATVTESGTRGQTGLLLAVEGGHLDTVQWLLQEGGASITDRDNEGYTALLVAALRIRGALRMRTKRCLEMVQWLLQEGGANITDRDNEGNTALLFAAQYRCLKMVQWLLQEGGASITDRDNEGNTALLLAALEGHLEIVQWLLQEGGADVTDTTHGGKSVWDVLGQRSVWGNSCLQLPLLKVLLARAAPFGATQFCDLGLGAGFQTWPHGVDVPTLLAQGTVVRQRLHANSPWRAQRATLLLASDCGSLLPASVMVVVSEYAELDEEELWAAVATESARTGISGQKRKGATGEEEGDSGKKPKA